MGTAIQIFIALIGLGVLWKSGFLPTFLYLGMIVIGMGLIFGLAWWLFGSTFSTGWNCGKWAAIIIYAFISIGMIITNESYEVEVFEDGSTEKHTDRARGIVGFLACVAMALLFIL
ncbi:MAG: hypothetical protein IJR13_05490 [Bacteroidales bacterium]|nr:hypothetical protein [Bacteroidales bacterium]